MNQLLFFCFKSDDPSSIPNNPSPTESEVIAEPNPEPESKPKLTCYSKNEEEKNYWMPAFCVRNKCEQVDSPPIFCRVKATLVKPFCDCVGGFFRDIHSLCVNENECRDQPKLKKPKCYGEYEELVDRLKPRDYRDCRNFFRSSSTSSSSSSSSSSCSFRHSDLAEFTYSNRDSEKVLFNVCNCFKGYYRNSGGECVKKKHCHRRSWYIHCPGPNEQLKHGRCVCKCGCIRNKCGQCVSRYEYDHTANCLCTDPCPGKYTIRHIYADDKLNSCENYLNRKNKVNTDPKPPRQYRIGCDCFEGRYLIYNGTCVKSKQCQ